MKHAALFAAALTVVAVATPVEAQIRLGIIGGFQRSELDLTLPEMTNDLSIPMGNITSFCMGASLDLPLNRYLSLLLEPGYLKKGGRLAADLPLDILSVGLSMEQSLIEVPVMLKAGFGKSLRPFVFAGPSAGFVLDSYVTMEVLGIGIRAGIEEITRRVQFGMCYGAGIEYSMNDFTVFVQGRFTTGLSGVLKDGSLSIGLGDDIIEETVSEDDLQLRNRGFQMTAGVRLPLGGGPVFK